MRYFLGRWLVKKGNFLSMLAGLSSMTRLSWLTVAMVALMALEVGARSIRWSLSVPAGWHQIETVSSGDDSLWMQLVPDQAKRGASVTLRTYERDSASLEDEFVQLRYAVVTRLDGRILKRETCSVAGVPALKVLYDGRSPSGDIRKYLRYLVLNREELLTVHCVIQFEAVDVPEFEKIFQSLTLLPELSNPE